MLQSGLFVADALYYNGDSAPNLVDPSRTGPGLGKGYDFDFYNKGWSDRNPRDGFKPIYPVQNSKTITQDVVGNIIFTDRNTAVVTPNAPTAGTDFSSLDGDIEHNGPATGWMDIIILQPDSLKPGHEYAITFTENR